MTRLESLRSLYDAVKAGVCPDFCPMWHAEGLCTEAEGAFSGSIDAALALHNDVLSGYVWNIVEKSATVWPDFPADPWPAHEEYSNAGPARAWLLAILSALIAQEEAKP